MKTTTHTCTENCKHYPIPGNCFIGINEKELYRIEGDIQDLISEAAEEIGKILEHKKGDFWSASLPVELYGILDSYDSKASEAAAIKYLTLRGFTVTN